VILPLRHELGKKSLESHVTAKQNKRTTQNLLQSFIALQSIYPMTTIPQPPDTFSSTLLSRSNFFPVEPLGVYKQFVRVFNNSLPCRIRLNLPAQALEAPGPSDNTGWLVQVNVSSGGRKKDSQGKPCFRLHVVFADPLEYDRKTQRATWIRDPAHRVWKLFGAPDFVSTCLWQRDVMGTVPWDHHYSQDVFSHRLILDMSGSTSGDITQFVHLDDIFPLRLRHSFDTHFLLAHLAVCPRPVRSETFFNVIKMEELRSLPGVKPRRLKGRGAIPALPLAMPVVNDDSGAVDNVKPFALGKRKASTSARAKLKKLKVEAKINLASSSALDKVYALATQCQTVEVLPAIPQYIIPDTLQATLQDTLQDIPQDIPQDIIPDTLQDTLQDPTTDLLSTSPSVKCSCPNTQYNIVLVPPPPTTTAAAPTATETTAAPPDITDPTVTETNLLQPPPRQTSTDAKYATLFTPIISPALACPDFISDLDVLPPLPSPSTLIGAAGPYMGMYANDPLSFYQPLDSTNVQPPSPDFSTVCSSTELFMDAIKKLDSISAPGKQEIIECCVTFIHNLTRVLTKVLI
jgi:hypothetical protein